MTTQKYLHELLRDDQEPFRLKKYIADRKCQLKRPISHRPNSSLQVIKPINQTSPIATSKRNFCVHSCFLAFNASSPQTKKSPFPSFRSPVTSPCSNHNGSVFLHIPARTASLLLDAALKIQKQQSTKPKTQIKNLGLGLFSSILKKLKDRKRSRKSEIGFGGVKKSTNSEIGISGSIDNTSGISSCRWSESNEGRRSLDMETSCSSLYENSEELDLVLAHEGENGVSKRFCSSPLSPFRFSLQKSSSSGGFTPIFASPSASPSSRKDQKESLDIKFGKEEEEEKDQSSPVSVLDPPFENDEEEEDGHDHCLDDDDYDVECSFALVQRAKEKLLYKLSRFERLAELDPIELEKRMHDEEEEYENGEQEDEELLSVYSIDDSYVNDVLSKSDILQYNNSMRRVSSDIEKLVSDLISEEKQSINHNSNKWSENGEILVGRVCRKLEWWKETESNTIDMMAEFDMRNELDRHHWKRFQQQKEETCLEFEVAILGLLVEEFTCELLQAPE